MVHKKYIFTRRRNFIIVGLIDLLGFGLKKTINIMFPNEKFQNKSIPVKTKKILVIRLDHIGDIVLSTPVFKCIKENCPQTLLSVLIAPWSLPIVQHNSYIDKLFVFRPFWFYGRETQKNCGKSLVSIIKRLRMEKFDVGLDLRGSLFHILLLKLIGVKFTIGYGIAGGGFFLDSELPYNPQLHEVLHDLETLRPLGVKIKEPELFIPVGEEEKLWANKFVKRIHKSCEKIIALHIGTGAPSRKWINERWARVADTLTGEFRAKILLLGGSNDVEDAISVISKMKSKPINLVARTSLAQMIALVKECNLLIGLESASVHIACAVGTPLVALYGGMRDSKKWRPWCEEKCIVLQISIHCAPCGLKNGCKSMECMHMIREEDVLESCRKLL